MDVLMLKLHLICDYGYKLKAFKLYHMPLDIEGLIKLILFLFFQGSQIPYDLLLFEISLKVLIKEFLIYYVFYVLSPIHWYLEKEV